MLQSGLKKWTLATFFFIGTCGALYAGLAVEPHIVELILPAGETHTGTYIVTNTSGEEVAVRVEPENWLKLRGVDTKQAEVPLSDWFQVSPDRFKLGSGESREIEFQIHLPSDTEGELVAMNFFTMEEPEGRGIALRRRFGFPFYAAAEDTSVISCEIVEENISAERPSLELKNTGNVHIRPEIYLIFTDQNGDAADQIELTGRTPLFPGQKERFSFRKDLPLAPGRYIAQIVVNYGMVFDKDLSIKGGSRELVIE